MKVEQHRTELEKALTLEKDACAQEVWGLELSLQQMQDNDVEAVKLQRWQKYFLKWHGSSDYYAHFSGTLPYQVWAF